MSQRQRAPCRASAFVSVKNRPLSSQPPHQQADFDAKVAALECEKANLQEELAKAQLSGAWKVTGDGKRFYSRRTRPSLPWSFLLGASVRRCWGICLPPCP